MKALSRFSFAGFFSAALLLLALAVPFASAKAAAPVDGAGKFVQSLGDRAISILADKSVTPEAASKVFRTMLETSFDLNLLGKFALGPNAWRAATPEQRQNYLQLFQKLVIQIYSDRFKLYSGESFKVVSSKPEDNRDSYVTSEIVKPHGGGAPVQVDWRVRNKDGRYQVIDVIVEGVSMSVSQRSEFMAVLQRNGGDLDSLLSVLRERVATVQG